jgi:hypothetical protein
MANNIENKTPVIIKQTKRIKPDWLKTAIPGGEKYSEMLKLVKDILSAKVENARIWGNVGEREQPPL